MQNQFQHLYLRRTPFAKILFPFILGIFLADYLPFLLSLILTISLFLSSIILFHLKSFHLSYKTNHIFGIIISLLLFFFGSCYTNYRLQINTPHYLQHLQRKTIFEGYISESLIEKEKYFETVITLNKLHLNNSSITTQGKIKCYFPKHITISPKLGDVLLFKTQLNTIKPPRLPKQFNYKKYLKSKGIFHSVNLSSNQFIKKKNINTLYLLSQKVRNYLIQQFKNSRLTQDELGIVSALFLGNKTLLNTNIKTNFSTIGAMHVLAVSGLHVGILLYIINLVLDAIFGKHKRTICKLMIALLFIWSFAFITGLSISVMRASIMFTLMTLGQLFLLNKSIYNTVFASAFILLIVNPDYVHDIGFQLSYIAVLGIVYFYPKIFNLIYLRNRILNYLWSITAVSIAAQTVTIPISIYYFHELSLLTIASNIFVTFFAILIIVIGLLMVITIYFQDLFIFLSDCLSLIIDLLLKTVTYFASIPFGKLEQLNISILELTLYFVALFLLILFIETKKLKYFNYALIISCCFTMSKHFYYINKNKRQKITFLNAKNQMAFNVTSKNVNKLYLSNPSPKTIFQLESSLKNFWVKQTSKKVEITPISPYNNTSITINNLKILILNKRLHNKIKGWYDFVFVNTSKISLGNINNFIQTNSLIISNKVPTNNFTHLKNQNKHYNLNIYSIVENPSFRIRL